MNFYILRDNDRYVSAEWDHDVMEKYNIYHSYEKSKKFAKKPHYLTLMLETIKIGDILWSWYSECILTQKVVDIFRRENVTGYHLEPVVISRIKYACRGDLEKLPKIYELQLRGWAGMARPESGIRLVKETEERLKYCYYTDPSKLIDESQWDGSDFFMLWPMPGFIFIAERVKETIEREKLTGCKIITPSELPPAEYPEYPLGPGRLRQWFPDDLAHKYGDPLGIY